MNYFCLNQGLRKTDTKIPSPKPFTEMLERQKKEKASKLPSPRRRNYKSTDHFESSPQGMLGFFQFYLIKENFDLKKKKIQAKKKKLFVLKIAFHLQ